MTINAKKRITKSSVKHLSENKEKSVIIPIKSSNCVAYCVLSFLASSTFILEVLLFLLTHISPVTVHQDLLPDPFSVVRMPRIPTARKAAGSTQAHLGSLRDSKHTHLDTYLCVLLIQQHTSGWLFCVEKDRSKIRGK